MPKKFLDNGQPKVEKHSLGFGFKLEALGFGSSSTLGSGHELEALGFAIYADLSR